MAGVINSNSAFYTLMTQSGFSFNGTITPFEMNVDQGIFQKNLLLELKRHPRYPDVVEEFVDEFMKNIVEDERLFYWSLTGTPSSLRCVSARGGNQDSLVRLLLGNDVLQPPVVTLLLEKLVAFSGDEHEVKVDGQVAHLPRLIMNQFRWLDVIVDPDRLSSKVLEILRDACVESQREIIAALPEIIDDQNHIPVSKALNIYMNQETLLPTVLDVIMNLNITPEMLSEIRDTALSLLSSVELDTIPIVVKFILHSIDAPTVAAEVITQLRRSLNLKTMLPSKEDATHKSGDNAIVLVFEVIKMALQFNKMLSDTWFKVIVNTSEHDEHQDVDLFLLLLLYTEKGRRKNLGTALRNKIRSELFTERLLEETFSTYSMVLHLYFQNILILASTLLHSSEPDVVHFGAALYKWSFKVFDNYSRQELIGALLAHIGSGNVNEVNVALDVLVQLAEKDTPIMVTFASVMKTILDFIDNLPLPQIRKVYNILSTLAYVGGSDKRSPLQDDLNIIMRKQLTHVQAKYKRMGVIAAVMTVKAIAPPHKDVSQDAVDKTANIIKSTRGCIKTSPEALSLLYDELGTLIFREQICGGLVNWINDRFVGLFADYFLLDIKADSPPTLTNDIVFLDPCIEEEPVEDENTIVVNLYPMVVKSESFTLRRNLDKADVLPTFVAHFRLLWVCEFCQKDHSLDEIGKLLTCGIYTFAKENLEEFVDLPLNKKRLLLKTIFYNINWFLELINAFTTQNCTTLTSEIVARLKSVVEMRGILSKNLALLPSFEPPPVNFDLEEQNGGIASSPRQGMKENKKRARENATQKSSKKPRLDQENSICGTMASSMGCTAPTQKINKKTSTKKTIDKVDLDNYARYFRELDVGVFKLLRVKTCRNNNNVIDR